MNDEDGPFHEVVDEVGDLLAKAQEAGRFVTVFQKFTCVSCQARKTMSQPNAFFVRGHCDSCGWTTNIEEEGCGYMLILSDDREEHDEFVDTVSRSIEAAPPHNRN